MNQALTSGLVELHHNTVDIPMDSALTHLTLTLRSTSFSPKGFAWHSASRATTQQLKGARTKKTALTITASSRSTTSSGAPASECLSPTTADRTAHVSCWSLTWFRPFVTILRTSDAHMFHVLPAPHWAGGGAGSAPCRIFSIAQKRRHISTRSS